jgi:hypothetical protein
MTPSTDQALTGLARRRTAVVVVAALALGSLGFSGCGVISKVKAAVHTVEGNKSTMDAFTNKIKSGATTFEVTYMTTGISPATVVYAVEPSKGLLFKLTQTPSSNNSGSNNNLDVVVNPTGEYFCTPPSGSGASSKWSCQKLPKASAADYNNIIDFYTPSHWVTFLDDFALAAGFAGDKVTDGSITVNGFAMSCVELVASGVSGTSKICTTSQNILGYVNVASDSTKFEIKSYSSSPSASLFQLPPGATITTVTIPTSTS